MIKRGEEICATRSLASGTEAHYRTERGPRLGRSYTQLSKQLVSNKLLHWRMRGDPPILPNPGRGKKNFGFFSNLIVVRSFPQLRRSGRALQPGALRCNVHRTRRLVNFTCLRLEKNAEFGESWRILVKNHSV